MSDLLSSVPRLSDGMVTALVAAITAILAASLTYVSTSRRDQLNGRIEICKYREKWLEQLRSEIVAMQVIFGRSILCKEKPKEDLDMFMKHMVNITLLVSDTNAHWPDLKEQMNEMFRRVFVDDYQKDEALDEKRRFVIISKDILKDEWDEIQDLLYKKRKQKNA